MKYRIVEDSYSPEDEVSFVISKDAFTGLMIKIMKAFNSSKSDKFRVTIKGRLFKGEE